MGTAIRTLKASDWPSVRLIYADGISTGQATFETDPPSWEQWDRAHLAAPRLIATTKEAIVGWAALSPVSRRAVYAGVAEVSVYVHRDSQGQGVGSLLLETLISESEKNGIWTLQASIFPENLASVSLHRSRGFLAVGRRHRIGKMRGIWRDTVLFERRSAVVGKE